MLFRSGYPVIERKPLMTGGDDFRRRHGIAPNQTLLAVLPGSRRSEIRFILPIFRETAARLAREVPGFVCAMPTVGYVAHLVREAAQSWPVRAIVTEGEREKYAAFDAADAALAASGTVTSELALSGTPMVVGYRLGWLTAALMRPLIHIEYVTLVNLVLGRGVIPEFVQEKCTPENLLRALKPLVADEAARAVQRAGLEEAGRAFGLGQESPSLRAARAVLELARGELPSRAKSSTL